MVKNFFILLLLFVCTYNLNAHGDLHERILKISEEIKVNPDSAILYFKRGKLFYQHNNFKNSLKDLNKSADLGYFNLEQDFLFAKNYYKLKKYRSSLHFTAKILKVQPNNVNAYKLVGKVYFKRNKFKKSAIAFEKVIKYSRETFPENYLDASRAWYALRTDKGIDRAHFLLIEGIELFGNNIVLYNKLITNYIELGDYSSAINFQKKVIGFSPRKERGYLKLANLQILQKNYTQAIKSLEIAKKYYSDLPNRIKVTKFMKDFYAELKLKEVMLNKEKLKSI